MRINFNPNIQQPKFQAVNKKYYDWAIRESRRHNYGELLTILKFDVCGGVISPQDGIDTVSAIKNHLAPKSWEPSFDRALAYIKSFIE